MMRWVVILGWLILVWVALWESATWANVLGGVAAALLVTLVVPPRTPGPWLRFRPVAALWLVIYFIIKLIEAASRIAWEVITPKSRVAPAVVNVQLQTRTPAIAILVANLVSLTPGTLTLEADEETMRLKVHVLHLHTIEEAREAVLEFERLSMRAFSERPAPDSPEGEGA
jgi:multicomponent Na+:H+ antiporter subunit E